LYRGALINHLNSSSNKQARGAFVSKALPTNHAIDSDAGRRCALPGARHRGR
jgi:hypothetical protein